MEPHGIHPVDGRKEINCSDCGHPYVIAQGQQSSRCLICGNIEFFAGPRKFVVREAAKIAPLERRPAPQSPLVAFEGCPDGVEVERIRSRFQVEWQLWAALVKKFEDPVYHSAYLCQAISAGKLSLATERYREHRSVMALLGDSLWQAEVADLMLLRIERITFSRLEPGRNRFAVPEWLLLAPLDARVIKVAWIAVGVFVGLKLLGFR
jgi:hypothetical protein